MSDSSLPPRSSPRVTINDPRGDEQERDIEAGVDEPLLSDTHEPAAPAQAPLVSIEEPALPKEYTPIRTDPIEGVDPKTIKRRLDRHVNEQFPEIHMIGRITFGQHLVHDISEGAFCRWKVSVGKSWQHLEGEALGQTQVAYCTYNANEHMHFQHPIDLHYACAGLQGWGAPRIAMQCFRFDAFGRRVLSGYGFGHLPATPGLHKICINLWRPLGSLEQEMKAFLLGETPSLVSHDPLYESAWKDRCRLITTSGGSISMEVYVMTRYWKEQGMQTT